MNLAALDLNLLVALEALLAEGHVGRAARRVGLSQPAASHALRRLRELLGDPLLVRVGAGMELTARAALLRAPLDEALGRVRGLFADPTFDPTTSARRFGLMMPDHVVDLLVPPLVERVAAAAPQVRLDVAPWRGPMQMSAELARSIDLVIACTTEAFAGFERQRLYSDRDALAVKRGHPARRTLGSWRGFAAARHVAVIGRGQREDPIDVWLRQHDVERRIALTVPGYLQALRIAAHSDLVAFVPRRLCEALAAALDLVVLDAPADPGLDDETMFYPVRAAADPGGHWLRALVQEIGGQLDGTKRTRTRTGAHRAQSPRKQPSARKTTHAPRAV